MAVIAYASSNPSPQANPDEDPVLDLSSEALPKTIQLYGAGEDTEDPGADFAYNWSIVSGPEGHSAVITNPTAQNPTIEVRDWGNLLVILVVQNTTTSETSESRAHYAPKQARVTVKVRDAVHQLEKPAPGERNFSTFLHALIGLVRTLLLGTSGAHSITDHNDVNDATGAQLEALTGGDYAEHEGSRLHKHKGLDIDRANRTNFGVVQLEGDPRFPLSPTAVNRDRVWFTSATNTSFRPKVEPEILPNLSGPSSPRVLPHLVFFIPEPVELDSWSASFLDSGAQLANTSYVLRLAKATESEMQEDNWDFSDFDAADVVLRMSTSDPANNNKPLSKDTPTELGVEVNKSYYLGVFVSIEDNAGGAVNTTDVQTIEGNPALGLSVTLHMHRRV